MYFCLANPCCLKSVSSNGITLFILFVGSPFNCKIGGVQSTKEESVSTRTVKTVETTHVGSVCELALKVPGLYPYFVYLAGFIPFRFILTFYCRSLELCFRNKLNM